MTITALALCGLAAMVGVVVGAGALYLWAITTDVDGNVTASAHIGECYGKDGSNRPIDCNGPHDFEVFTGVIYP